MADPVGDVLRDDDVRESFDSFLIDAVPDAHLGGLGLGVHLGIRALNDGHAQSQS